MIFAVHTVGAPLAHVASPYVDPFWKQFASLNELRRPEFKFVQGSLQKIDLASKSLRYSDPKNGNRENRLSYDYLITATGLRRPWPVVPQAGTKDEYVKAARANIDDLSNAEHVVVVGGGKYGASFHTVEVSTLS